jgi:hypothetical protein
MPHDVRKPALDLSVIVRRAFKVDTGEHHKCAFVERSANCSAAPSGQAPTPNSGAPKARGLTAKVRAEQ